MKTIYISGKITGMELSEAQNKFNAKELELLKGGDRVINPMKISSFKEGKMWIDYMCDDIKHLFTATAIYMMPCWKDSQGAKIEHCIAQHLGLEIIYG